MDIDWDSVLDRLRKYPPGTHDFLPPCADGRISEMEAQLGRLPSAIKGMLRRFNGASLFNRSLPLITLFGISVDLPLPTWEWAEDWWIDEFTPAWRTARNREKDWVIAITSGDTISIVDDDGSVRQWDRDDHCWGITDQNLNAWIERILKEGEEYMKAP